MHSLHFIKSYQKSHHNLATSKKFDLDQNFRSAAVAFLQILSTAMAALMAALQRHRLEMLPADGTLGATPMKLQLFVESLPGVTEEISVGGGVEVSGGAICHTVSVPRPIVEFDVDVASLRFGEDGTA